MILDQKQIDEIRKMAYPLVSYLETLANPHLKIIIDGNNVEVLEGIALIKETSNQNTVTNEGLESLKRKMNDETDFNPEKP